jgi:hypothetical protein
VALQVSAGNRGNDQFVKSVTQALAVDPLPFFEVARYFLPQGRPYQTVILPATGGLGG